uniref:Uncharacterized protein n=1 Tax=Setaria italica TaxID=4555 RepID=K3YDJ3_SETIT
MRKGAGRGPPLPRGQGRATQAAAPCGHGRAVRAAAPPVPLPRAARSGRRPPHRDTTRWSTKRTAWKAKTANHRWPTASLGAPMFPRDPSSTLDAGHGRGRSSTGEEHGRWGATPLEEPRRPLLPHGQGRAAPAAGGAPGATRVPVVRAVTPPRPGGEPRRPPPSSSSSTVS